MSGGPAWRVRLASLLWLIAAAAALAMAFASSNLRGVILTALTHVNPLAVLATLPGQAVAILLCSSALYALRPGVTFQASLLSRLLRDAGSNLLVFLPGLGELIGARALVLAGGQARAAVTASVLDKVSEAMAQTPFAILALLLVPRLAIGGHLHAPPLGAALTWAAVICAVAAGLAALIIKLSPAVQAALGRSVIRLRTEWALLYDEWRRQQRGFPIALGLHFIAWAMGGVQIWMVAQALAVPLDLFSAIVIESAAFAVRGAAFFIPAGLGVQEATLVFAGLAFGLDPAQSIAIALVLRLRDIAFGLPLLLYPIFEIRRARLTEASS